MKQLFIIITNSVKNIALFLMSIFRLYLWLKMSFEHNAVRIDLFLKACFCWDGGLSSREMDHKFKFGGTIVYGNSYLEFLFHCFKVFRLHGILHDAAGAVRAHRSKRPGYCYMIGRGPTSCLLGHVTGLLLCLYVKLFLPSIFNSVDFWGSLFCIVLAIELADKNVIRKSCVFIDGKVQGYSFCPPKKYRPTKQAFWCTKNLHRILYKKVDVWITVSFQTFFLEL